MLAVAHELVQRYNQHPSFGGLAIELSADGYAQLPGDLWGLDDDTIGRFQHDSGIQVPGTGRQSIYGTGRLFRSIRRHKHRQPATDGVAQMACRHTRRFLSTIAKRAHLRSARRRLLFDATNLFDAPEAQRLVRPSLPTKVRIDQALLNLGLATDLLRDQRGMVLLRPTRFSPVGSLAGQGTDLELNRASQLDEQFHRLAHSGTIFLNNPQPVRLPSFEARSPFRQRQTLR